MDRCDGVFIIKVIACKIYEYYISQLDLSLDNYEFVYLDIQQHNQPHTLAKNIQKEIDKSRGDEKIIVLYGLCGNAIVEIQARNIPVYLVRVHDCLTVLLGSKQRFKQLFSNRLSSSWSCYSLKVNGCNVYEDEQYLKWCQRYDQETADYLKSQLQTQDNVYLIYNYCDDVPFLKNQEQIKIDLKFLKQILLQTSNELVILEKNQKVVISSDIDQVFEIMEE